MQADFNQETTLGPVTSAPAAPPVTGFWQMVRQNVRLLHTSPPIQRAPRQQPLPLSLNQERLWQLERLQPATSVHTLLHSLRFVGALDLAVLERSLRELVRRHEVLRTTIRVVNGQPTQVITAEIELPLHRIDLRGCSAAEQARVLEQQTQIAAEQVFDLAQGPLWRVVLVQLSERESVLLRSIHHIIFDGQSHSLFMRELGALYGAFERGDASPLLELAVQYADVAWTQRHWLQGAVLAEQMEYWQQQFAGDVEALVLPTAGRCAVARTYRGASVRRVLPVAVSAGLNALSAELGVSLFVTLMAGFNALLHQYSGQVDLVVCTPVVGRQRRETRGLLGYFNHVVALRHDLSGNPGFRELVERVGQRFLEASSYQEVPLQWVAELPSLVRVPLSRAMFVLQNTAAPVLKLDGLVVSSEFVEGEIANFDLSLSVAEQEGQLAAVLQYKTDLFNSDTIAQMLEQYIALLERLIINPDQHLSDLPALKQNQTVSYSLSNAAEVNSSLDPQYVAPRNALEQDLAQIWQNTFKVQPIGITDNFFTLGGHSLLAVEMLTRIEQQCGTKLSITTLLQAPTIAALAEVIQTSGEELMNDLVPLKLGGSKPPLFCLYGVLLYQELAHQLDPDQPVYGVFLKEEVELLKAGQADQFKSIFSSVPAIASRYLETIRQQQPHGPYYLCGESFGGLVAYEIAQQLTAIGEEVALVALFDSLPPTEYSHAQLKLRDRVGMHLKLLRQQGVAYLYEKAEPYKQKVQQKLIAAGMTLYQPLYPVLTKIVGKSRLQHKLTQVHQALSYSADGIQQEDIREQVRRQMTQGYVLQPYSGTLLLFRAMKRDAFETLGYDLGWGEVASDDFHIYDIPGDHIGILKSPNVQGLAEKLQQHITVSHPQKPGLKPLKLETERL